MSETQENPYSSSNAAPRREQPGRSRFAPFVTGLVGLAIGAGFYLVLCAFWLAAKLLKGPNAPPPNEAAFVAGAAVIHSILLALWIWMQRRLYRLRSHDLWGYVVTCWLLIPLSAIVLVWNLGF